MKINPSKYHLISFKRRKRERAKSGKENPEKLFGKWHDIIMVLIAFILTTGGGSLIGYLLQDRSWKNRHEQSHLESEKEKAEEIFGDLSTLMDTRLYKMRRIVWGYKGNKGESDIEKRWEEYVEILNEWNTNIGKNMALIQMYFGTKAREEFEYEIHASLREAGIGLENYKNEDKKNPDTLLSVESILDDINVKIYQYDLRLLEAISEERIGRILKKEKM